MSAGSRGVHDGALRVVLTIERSSCHGVNSTDRFGRAAPGRRTHLATQPQLGLRPQRWFGTGVGDCDSAPAPGIPPARLLGAGEDWVGKC